MRGMGMTSNFLSRSQPATFAGRLTVQGRSMTGRFPMVAAIALLALTGLEARAGGPDLSTPKKAALEFAKDLESGDMAAAKAASVGSADDFKLVETISSLVRSARELRDTAIEKFGAAGKNILPNGDELADFSKRVDSGTEKITGDTATVGQPDERDPMKLKKVEDGTWRVDLAAIPEKNEVSKVMPKVQKVLSNATADIKAGKYKTADEAQDAVSQQMFAVIAEQANSANSQSPPGEKK